MKNFKIIIVVTAIVALAVGGYVWKSSKKSVCCPHDAPAAGHHDEGHDNHAGHDDQEKDGGHEGHADHGDEHAEGGHADHGDEHGKEGHDDHGEEEEEGVIHLSKESMELGGIETVVVSKTPLIRTIRVNGRVAQDAETEDMTQVAAVFDVYELNFPDVRVGQSINVFSLTDADHKHSGRITFVSSRVDALANTLKVRAVIDNADLDWKLGMFLKGEILIDSQESAVAVPAKAVQTIDNKSVVFVRTAEDTFEVRTITIVSEHGGNVFVSRGLKKGDEIVVNGSFIMKSKTMESEMEHAHSH